MSVRFVTLIGLMASVMAGHAMAQTATAQDKQWFVNLLNSHMGHEFCPPPGTTFGAAATAVHNYVVANHGHQDMTDAEWLQVLASIYPCSKPKELSADEAQALGAKPVGSVGGHYTVHPTGIYATIDNSITSSLLDELHQPTSPELEARLKSIEDRAGNYAPIVLMQVAIDEYNAGNHDKSIFWFHVALLRILTDVKLCSDPSVGNTPNLIVRRTLPDLVKASFSDDPKIGKIVEDAVAWDAKTPYNYDHRWIALQSAGATNSALNPTHAPKTLTVPETDWPVIMEKNREIYPKLVANNISRLKASAPSH